MMEKNAQLKKKQTYERGIWAESLAALYLSSKGYRILRRRYKTAYGEIDLVMKKGDMVCFVEVKTRPTEAGAMESVSVRAQGRIEKAALAFVAEYPEYMEHAMRFDVVAVIPPFHIVHLDNAWEACS